MEEPIRVVILAYCSYATLKFVYDIGSWSYFADSVFHFATTDNKINGTPHLPNNKT